MIKRQHFFIIFIFVISCNVFAVSLLESAKVALEKEQFSVAISLLEKAVEIEPNVSENHRWLGHAYGLMARNTSWFKAIGWAKKSRLSLEKAVDIDPANIEALLDLRIFYSQAPPFLGGGEDKVAMINQKLKAVGYDVEAEK